MKGVSLQSVKRSIAGYLFTY